jgi:Holliday junction DNA helicase RuvA
MIGLLKGEIIDSGEDYLIISAGGVGYKVETEAPHRLGLEGQDVEVRIYTHVREREIRLFGFPSKNELNIFEKLLDVSGVGPKSAMSIVSTYSVGQIISAIKNDEPKKLKVKGVGKKTLAKVAIELSGKLDEFSLGKEEAGEEQIVIAAEEHDELISALESLGYQRDQVEDVIPEVDTEESISVQIKQALKLLN